MTDWGTPDWTDGGAYPRKLTMREWWWQFTRRRPDYRDLWARWAPINAARIEREWPALEPLMGDQTKNDLLDRAVTDDPEGLQMTFGMVGLLNPARDFSDWLLWQNSKPINYMDNAKAIGSDDAVESLKQSGLVRYVFNISKPLNPQMRRAETALKLWQEEFHRKQNTPKPNTQNWPDYLRVLDAREAGASYRQIGTVLWPKTFESGGKKETDKQTVRDFVKAAQRVRDNFPI